MLVLIASCLFTDSPHEVEPGLLITAYQVLMGVQVRQTSPQRAGKG